MRPLLFFKLTRFDRRFATALHAVGLRPLTDAHGLFQLRPDEVEADPVVGSEPGREAARDELLVDGPSPLLAVVVWTRAPGQEAETGGHGLGLRAGRGG